MSIIILQILVIVICIEAITELAVKSEFFFPLRKYLFESNSKILNYIHNVFDCGYCFSVWASMLIMTSIFIFNGDFLWFCLYVIAMHRLSNMLHFIIDRLGMVKR